MAPHLPAIAAACDVQTGRFIAIDSNQFDAAPLFAIAFTHNCKCGSPLWAELRSQTAVAWKSANGAQRKHDLTDGLPFTVRERTFALRPADGKVCPEAVILACDRLG